MLKDKRRIFLIFVCLILVFSIFTVSADANENIQENKDTNLIRNLFRFLASSLINGNQITGYAAGAEYSVGKPIEKDEDKKISKEIRLAEEINGQLINAPEIQHYFEIHKNIFSDIKFKRFVKALEPIKIKLGSFNLYDIKGIEINKKGYILHAIYCNKYENYCTLMINGIPTGRLYNSEINDSTKQTEFALDNTHKIRIKSIIFDYCDGRRFCDYHYDAYDIINLEIERDRGIVDRITNERKQQ